MNCASQAGLTLATGDTVIKFRSLFSISFFALSPHQKLYRRHYTHRFSATCSLNELHMRSEGSFITFHSFAASIILLRRMLHFFFGKWMFFLFSLKDCYYDNCIFLRPFCKSQLTLHFCPEDNCILPQKTHPIVVFFYGLSSDGLCGINVNCIASRNSETQTFVTSQL